MGKDGLQPWVIISNHYLAIKTYCMQSVYAATNITQASAKSFLSR